MRGDDETLALQWLKILRPIIGQEKLAYE